MKLNKYKQILSIIFSKFKIYILIEKLQSKCYCNRIRAINYHSVSKEYSNQFETQLNYFQQHYANVTKSDLDNTFSMDYIDRDKPGILISFDDGFLDNYTVAAPLLEKYGFTGYFFVPSITPEDGSKLCIYDNNELFMNWNQIIDLINRGHVIGCHTMHHHRFHESDSIEVVVKEITDSKRMLEQKIDQPVDIFCWVGGEEDTYTNRAMLEIIKAGYSYTFTTMAGQIKDSSNKHFLYRTNVEANWPLHIVKFQTLGPMDVLSLNKKRRVYKKLFGTVNN